MILFNTPEAREKFVKSGDWSVGADASVAVMKKGVGGTYDSQTLKKPVVDVRMKIAAAIAFARAPATIGTV